MIRLRDVTLRDGLQDERPIPTEAKIDLFLDLVGAGLRDLELVSFVRPDRVPAMADADQLARTVAEMQVPARIWGLVLNSRGVERATATGIKHLQFVLSASEAHNQRNAGGSVEDSLNRLEHIVELCPRGTACLEVTVATAFGCPFTGPVDATSVIGLIDRICRLGVSRISLADTIGTAIPTEVGSVVAEVRRQFHLEELGIHLHDTRGLAVANALAAIEAGVDRIDGTVGGLGGCPFAPGASGNLPLEDLVHVLNAMEMPTDIDLDALIRVAHVASELVGKVPTSHISVAGPRFVHLAD